jgi:hypothetical protein
MSRLVQWRQNSAKLSSAFFLIFIHEKVQLDLLCYDVPVIRKIRRLLHQMRANRIVSSHQIHQTLFSSNHNPWSSPLTSSKLLIMSPVQHRYLPCPSHHAPSLLPSCSRHSFPPANRHSLPFLHHLHPCQLHLPNSQVMRLTLKPHTIHPICPHNLSPQHTSVQPKVSAHSIFFRVKQQKNDA